MDDSSIRGGHDWPTVSTMVFLCKYLVWKDHLGSVGPCAALQETRPRPSTLTRSTAPAKSSETRGHGWSCGNRCYTTFVGSRSSRPDSASPAQPSLRACGNSLLVAC